MVCNTTNHLLEFLGIFSKITCLSFQDKTDSECIVLWTETLIFIICSSLIQFLKITEISFVKCWFCLYHFVVFFKIHRHTKVPVFILLVLLVYLYTYSTSFCICFPKFLLKIPFSPLNFIKFLYVYFWQSYSEMWLRTKQIRHLFYESDFCPYKCLTHTGIAQTNIKTNCQDNNEDRYCNV